MDETTLQVMALIQARMQVLVGAMAVTLRDPIPDQSFGEQLGRFMRSVPLPQLLAVAETGAQQIRLMAEMYETKDPARKEETMRELLVLDQLIQAGLAELWSVPPRPKT